MIFLKTAKKCDFPLGEVDFVDLQKKKKVRGGKRNIAHEGGKKKLKIHPLPH